MIYLNVFKLNGLLTFEIFVLICAFFLLAYINKNSLNKWLRYFAIATIVVIKLLILCTIVNAFIQCCNRNNCRDMSSSCMSKWSGHHGGQMKCCKGGEKINCSTMHEKEEMEEEEHEHEVIIKDSIVVK